jgi:hypothetical protein
MPDNLTLTALPIAPLRAGRIDRLAAQIVELQREPASDRREEKIAATIMLVPPVQRGALWAAVRTLDQG